MPAAHPEPNHPPNPGAPVPPLRVVYLGSGDIGLPTLRRLAADPRTELAAVVTQPDKPVGRRRQLQAPPIKDLALELGLPVLQPERLRHPDAVAALAALKPDLLVVFAYGQLLSPAVLDLPTVGCWNLHASLLPRHRGAAPIQAAIRDGDRESGMTLMWMDRGLDTGDLLCADTLPLEPDETGQSLHDKLARLAPRTLDRGLDLLLAGRAPRQPQDHAAATHAGKLTRDHGRIDWNQPATVIERAIRAHHPWPGSHTAVTAPDGRPRTLKLFPPVKPSPVTDHDQGAATPPPGTMDIQGDQLRFRAADGWLLAGDVQPENARRMSAAEFARGWR